MDQISVYVGAGSFLLAVLGFALTMFKYIQGSTSAASREAADKVDSLRRDTDAKMQRLEEASDKSRHSLATSFGVAIGKLEADLRTLGRDSVRREEMGALETRIVGYFSKLETKVDVLADRLGEMRSHEREMKTSAERLDKLVAKITENVT